MGAILFIGDELTAAGYRLAGVRVRIASADAVRSVLADVDVDEETEVALILLTASLAAALHPKDLARRLKRSVPLLQIVDELGLGAEPPNLAREIRLSLGVEP